MENACMPLRPKTSPSRYDPFGPRTCWARVRGVAGGSWLAGVGVQLVDLVESGLLVQVSDWSSAVVGVDEDNDFADAPVGKVGEALLEEGVARFVWLWCEGDPFQDCGPLDGPADDCPADASAVPLP